MTLGCIYLLIVMFTVNLNGEISGFGLGAFGLPENNLLRKSAPFYYSANQKDKLSNQDNKGGEDVTIRYVNVDDKESLPIIYVKNQNVDGKLAPETSKVSNDQNDGVDVTIRYMDVGDESVQQNSKIFKSQKLTNQDNKNLNGEGDDVTIRYTNVGDESAQHNPKLLKGQKLAYQDKKNIGFKLANLDNKKLNIGGGEDVTYRYTNVGDESVKPNSKIFKGQKLIGLENMKLASALQLSQSYLQKYSKSEKINNAQEHFALLWPKGIVSYYFDNSSYDDALKARVKHAMDYIESKSCLRFRPIETKVSRQTWIHITNPNPDNPARECVHKFEEKDKAIIMVIGLDCLSSSELVHTILHAVGLKDEVTHPQRDQYVRITWDNIQSQYRHLFGIQRDDSQLVTDYDPLSIMQFHRLAFSWNGRDTIVPLSPGLRIGSLGDISLGDKTKLDLLFGHECKSRDVDKFAVNCIGSLTDKARLTDKKAIHHGQNNKQHKEGAMSEVEDESLYVPSHVNPSKYKPNVDNGNTNVNDGQINKGPSGGAMSEVEEEALYVPSNVNQYKGKPYVDNGNTNVNDGQNNKRPSGGAMSDVEEEALYVPSNVNQYKDKPNVDSGNTNVNDGKNYKGPIADATSDVEEEALYVPSNVNQSKDKLNADNGNTNVNDGKNDKGTIAGATSDVEEEALYVPSNVNQSKDKSNIQNFKKNVQNSKAANDGAMSEVEEEGLHVLSNSNKLEGKSGVENLKKKKKRNPKF